MKIELTQNELVLLVEAMNITVKQLGLTEQSKQYFILADKINAQLAEDAGNGRTDTDTDDDTGDAE